MAKAGKQAACLVARQQEFAREHISEALAKFVRAVGFDALQAKRRAFLRRAGVRTTRRNRGLRRFNPEVTELVCLDIRGHVGLERLRYVDGVRRAAKCPVAAS